MQSSLILRFFIVICFVVLCIVFSIWPYSFSHRQFVVVFVVPSRRVELSKLNFVLQTGTRMNVCTIICAHASSAIDVHNTTLLLL